MQAPIARVIYGEWIGLKEGLPQGFVSTILKDKEGYMWFSTHGGLSRYDGYRMKVFKHEDDDSFSIPDNMISGIFIDSFDNFWVGTRNKGLFLFNRRTEQFLPVNDIPEIKNMPIHLMKHGTNCLLVKSYNKSILLHLPNFHVPMDTPDLNSGLKKAFSKKFRDTGTLLDENNYLYLLDDQHLAYRANDSVFLVSKKGDAWEEEYLKELSESFLHAPNFYFAENYFKNHCIYVATNSKVVKFNLAQRKPVFVVKQQAVGNFIPVQTGIFYAVNRNLFFFNEKTGISEQWFFKQQNSDASFGLSIFFDDQGQCWFGTSGFGVFKADLQKDKFHVHRTVEFKLSQPIDSIWQGVPEKENPLDYVAVQNMELDRQSNYWIITSDLNQFCLWKYDRIKHKRTIIQYYTNILKIRLMKDNHDSVWIFLQEKENKRKLLALNSSDGCIMKSFMIPDNTPSIDLELVTGIATSPNYRFVYLSTFHGLLQLDLFERDTQKQWMRWVAEPTKPNALPTSSLWSVCLDPLEPSNYLWLGSMGSGCFKFNIHTGTCNTYNEKNGLPNNVVYGIISDSLNRLWMSTNNGLACFNPKTSTWIYFNEDDGLQGNEFNRNYYFKSPQGKLVFGGVNGYNVFSPQEVTEKQKTVPLVFNGLYIDNKEVLWKQQSSVLNTPIQFAPKIVIQPEENNFTLSFASLEYRSNHKKMYRYRMLGLYDRWTSASQKNEANFSGLNPGTYTLEVIGSNTSGVWNPKAIQMIVVVLPYWYQTWWFKLLVVCLIGYLVYLFYRFRLKQQLKVLHMRNSIAADLHDEIGSSLSSITLYSEVAAQLAQNKEASSMIDKIKMNAMQVQESMSDIVWAIQSRNESLSDLVNRIRECAVQLAEAASFELIMKTNKPIPTMSLDPEQRKNIYLFCKEALHNAAKYAGCSTLQVSIHVVKQVLHIEITDNGKGFLYSKDQAYNQKGKGGNGLFTMQKRAKELQGIMTIRTALGEGTSIYLDVEFKQRL